MNFGVPFKRNIVIRVKPTALLVVLSDVEVMMYARCVCVFVGSKKSGRPLDDRVSVPVHESFISLSPPDHFRSRDYRDV